MTVQHSFRATLETEPGSSATFVIVPFEVEQAFGSRGRIPVRGSINGFDFRGSLSPYAGRHYLGVNAALRKGAGVQAGDTVEFSIERDDEVRSVAVPADLAEALSAKPAAQAAWDKLSYSHQREHVQAIEEAKKAETRARRVEKAVAMLLEGKAP